MFRAALIAVALAFTLAAPSARACIRPVDVPGETMAEGRWVTVAVASVVEVRSRAPERPNRAFDAVFRIERTIDGHPQAGRLTLSHQEVSECPIVLPLPVVGEPWAVYLEWDARGDGPVARAWPLTWAQRLDPRFGGRADADISDLRPPRG
jgi:hypothetical protein